MVFLMRDLSDRKRQLISFSAPTEYGGLGFLLERYASQRKPVTL
jgi:hypothetical protein